MKVRYFLKVEDMFYAVVRFYPLLGVRNHVYFLAEPLQDLFFIDAKKLRKKFLKLRNHIDEIEDCVGTYALACILETK